MLTSRYSALIIVGGPVVAVTVGVLAMRACGSSSTQPLSAGALRGANVLLVTIDTLRADHVGAFGSDGALTPTIDAFAKEGLRFNRTYAHVPLTLPSHASLMTALYPTRNGVRDNGTFRLAAGSKTLASAFRAAGYRTAAFVGAFILDARFGLNQGFDLYDDRMVGSGSDLEVVQRTAEQVLTPAESWILGGSAAPSTAAPRHPAPEHPAPGTPAPGTAAPSTPAPFFVWIHLYDPHEPYTPPEPYRSRYAPEPYDGEVAYTDAALGGFLGRLRAAGALGHTLVVITSDHGESLGEHGERTHGLFAYDATLRVPLIMWAAGKIRAGAFDGIMRLVDVAPTILDLVGVRQFESADGRSVRPFIAGERPYDDVGSYFEALNANLTRGWAPLTGIVRDRLKLIDLPLPELYDLSSDPGEQKNLYAQQRERARDLEARLDRITGAALPPTPSSMDADAEARLRSLGYIVAPAAKPSHSYTANDDPKRLAPLNAALDDAAAAWSSGNADRAIGLLRSVLRDRPDFTIASDRLAFMLRGSGRLTEAVQVLDASARDGHADRSLLRSLASMLRESGDLKRSATILEELVRDDPSDLQSADTLGQTYTRMGRGSDAEAQFERVLSASPNAAATITNLGALYLTENRTADAIATLTRAIAINPDLPGAHNALGVAYARQGRMDSAVEEWQRALALRPGFPDALYNLQRAGK